VTPLAHPAAGLALGLAIIATLLALTTIPALAFRLRRWRADRREARCPSCGGHASDHVVHTYSGVDWRCVEDQRPRVVVHRLGPNVRRAIQRRKSRSTP